MGLRCFVAIELPEDIRAAIERTLSPLKSKKNPVKWVSAENMHLTLKFLGDTPEEKIIDITAALSEAASGIGPMEMGVKGAGAFPDMRRPNVLWVGLKCPKELETLYLNIQTSLARLGIEHDDRKFSPHITIGRLRRGTGRPREMMEKFAALKSTDFGSFSINGISLMKSDLTPSGPVYTLLATASLLTP